MTPALLAASGLVLLVVAAFLTDLVLGVAVLGLVLLVAGLLLDLGDES